MPRNTALAMKPMILYTGVSIPTVAALSSSSRIASRPVPSLVRRIHHESSSDAPRRATSV
jgi:hypothetical protein